MTTSLTRPLAACAALLFFAGCAAETAEDENKADADVTGVYASAVAGGEIERLALAKGQYAMTRNACAPGVAQCLSKGTFALSSDRTQIELRDEDTGETRTLPFAVMKTGAPTLTSSGETTTQGLCIVGADPSQGGCRTDPPPPASGQELVTPSQSSIVVRCTGNCAITIEVNGQRLTTTGESLTVEVPR